MLKSPYRYAAVFDFETGGLDKNISAITEFAYSIVNLTTLEIVESEGFLIKPYEAYYNEDSLQVTGITMQMLEEEGEELTDVVQEFIDIMEFYTIDKIKPIATGHNLDDFDMAFMKKILSKYGRGWDRVLNNNTTFDTLKLARMAFLELENYKLTTVIESIGLELEGAHRAVNDTEATAKLLIHFLTKIREK